MLPFATIILAGISLVEVLFLVLALISATTDDGDILQNWNWSVCNFGSDGKTYWGLLAMYQDFNYRQWYTYEGVFKYDDDSCQANVCNNCGTAGQVVIGFCALGIVTAVVALSFYVLRTYDVNKTSTVYKYSSNAATFLTLACSGTAVIVWGGACQSYLYSKYDTADVTVGPAYGMVLSVAIISLIAFIMDVFLTSTSESSLTVPLNPSAPSAPSAPTWFGGSSSSSAPAKFATTSSAPAHCSFCGKKGAREYPSHPEETTRFCSVCGKRHIVEEGLRYCTGCGTEIKF